MRPFLSTGPFVLPVLLAVWFSATGLAGESAVTEPGDALQYLGRPIAQTMHASGSDWLIRTEREREESAREMIRELGLKPGLTVADVGCGIGFHAIPMARLVRPDGRVLCVDIQAEMLRQLDARAREAGVTNCVSVLGEDNDPRLPEDSVDLILLVDAYHEFADPRSMLARMRTSLRPTGLLVLVEFRAEDPSVPIKPDHKMSRPQILKEMAANGFVLSRSYEKLPWQHMLFFAKE